MEDVLEVYLRPRNRKKPLVCLDEASKQLIAETRKSLPVEPGIPQLIDAEYRRCCTASVFMMTAPLEGQRHVRVRQQRKRADFAYIIRELCDDVYPDADKIVLVMDNLNTHNVASLYEAFEPCEAWRLAEKLEIHHTPKHGSWLNMAEIELSILSRQCMNDYFGSIAELTDVITAWQESRNEKKIGMHWRFTTAAARIKLRKLYPTI